MTKFNWLHLTDFHRGIHGWAWPNVKEIFFKDLEKLHDKCGPWDIVLFTGDLTQEGSEKEFQQVSEILDQLWEHFEMLGSDPKLIAVPGNHDLVRPNPKDPSVRLLRQWDEDTKEEFWEEPDSPYRDVVKRAFRNYNDWHQSQPHIPDNLTPGMLTGDFSFTLEKQGFSLGIVGLNTAFLQLAGGDYKGKLAIHTRQFNEPCAGDGPGWTKQHHACILLTHHPPSWLDDESQKKHLNGEITCRGHFAAHLCGHLHEAHSVIISEGGTEPRRIFQGSSLFGLEHFGEQDIRVHGYTGGTVRMHEDKGELLFWPREARLQGSERNIVPDTSLRLEDDQQHTEPMQFDLLRSPGSEIIQPVVPADIRVRIPESYRTWVAARCGSMDIDRLRERGRVIQVKLPELFIHLYANPPAWERETETFETDESDREKVFDVEDLIDDCGYLLVEGQAGSGKTTLMKYYCYTMLTGKDQKSDEFLPILIFMKFLKDFDTREMISNEATAEKILEYYFKETENGLDIKTVKQFCCLGKAVFLFDGLDETDRVLRDLVAGSFADFRDRNQCCKMIFSGRPHGIEGAVVDRFGGRHVRILPLNTDQVGDFIRKWFCFVLADEEAACREKTADDMITEMRAHPAVDKLKETPLMLTAICMLYFDGKELPGQRAELYKKFVEYLLYRRFDDPEKVHRFLKSLALEMHLKRIVGTDRGPALDVLGSVYAKKDENETDQDYCDRLEKEFDRIEPNCGLLKFENGQYIFWHLTFQEFLTAEALVDRERRNYFDAIRKHWDDVWYREVAELYIGYLSIQNMGMANEIVRRILEEDDGKSFMKWRLAARCLESIHKDRRESEVVGLATEKLLLVIDSDARPKDRAEAGEILGRLGDPRNLKEFIWVEGGKYFLSQGEIEIKPFKISKYPVTNGWFAEFVNAGGYENYEYWSEKGWEWLKETGYQAPRFWYNREWNCPNAPVVEVSWYEADAFARWMTLTGDGFVYSLPDEDQWEAAGFEKRGYPWGKWKEGYCNSREAEIGKICSVGIFKKGDTPRGVSDLAGNVREWTCRGDDSHRVLRGGSWNGSARGCRSAYRSFVNPGDRDWISGFRLVLLPGQQVTGK
ncbi:MAG: SUMF1/EgtB/PvdO family nonheme iron enzyme [Desulfobacteraceae bacterium]|nr:SUMF1/EgtB/PvdO family nonheme iron enzyme [Desulfobacteraceae bacterium]